MMFVDLSWSYDKQSAELPSRSVEIVSQTSGINCTTSTPIVTCQMENVSKVPRLR
jgi:hypothetical protein